MLVCSIGFSLLFSNYFVYNDTVYKQIQDCTKETSLGATLHNPYKEETETKVILKEIISSKYLKSYVDNSVFHHEEQYSHDIQPYSQLY